MSEFNLKVQKEPLMQAVQSLQMMIQEIRRVENGVTMLMPIAGNDRTTGALKNVAVWCNQIQADLLRMYNDLAPEAFK
jgi:uncharacterized protein YpbB